MTEQELKDHKARFTYDVGGEGIQHTCKNIVCETCVHRPCEWEDGTKQDSAITDICQIFKHPASKPKSVLWDGAPCEHYQEKRPQ